MLDKLENFLAARQARVQVVHHAGAVTAQEQAATTHTSGWALAKVLVVKERDGYVLAAVPAATVVDLDRLGGLIGHGDVRLATLEEARGAVGGCSPGAIPPFGALFGMHTYLDHRLLAGGEVTVPGGDFQTLLRLRSSELRRLAEPRVGDFAVPEAVVEAGGARLAGRRRRRAG